MSNVAQHLFHTDIDCVVGGKEMLEYVWVSAEQAEALWDLIYFCPCFSTSKHKLKFTKV